MPGKREIEPESLKNRQSGIVTPLDVLDTNDKCETDEPGRDRFFLSSLLDHITTGVLVLDGNGALVMANLAAKRMLGNESEVPGETELPPLLAPGRAGSPSFFSGRDLPENVICHGPEGRLLSFHISRLPQPDRDGSELLVAMVEDVTDQVRLGAQRERAHALTAMGEMAAEVAHQIRNPLGGIELFASILGREVSGDRNLERLVDNLLGGAKEINHLITNYLALARPHQPVTKPVNLVRLAEEALEAADEAMSQKKIQSKLEADGGWAWVDGDAELLLQVFLNLTLNAVEALRMGGRLTITIQTVQNQVDIRFQDTGRGIAQAELGRVFNPFFTTKDKNLGLGLAVSHRIIDAHQGMIQVAGRPGKGAAVTVTLPALPANEGRSRVA